MTDNDHIFKELYTDNFPPIKAKLFRATSDRELAEELAQECFLRVWRAMCMRPIANLRAFAYRCATNLLIDHYRSVGTRRRITGGAPIFSLDVPRADLPDEQFQVEDEDVRADCSAEFNEAMAFLEKHYPPEYRAIAVGLCMEGHTPKSLAKKLNMNADMVSVRFFRIRKEARAYMASCLIGEEPTLPKRRWIKRRFTSLTPESSSV